MTKNIVKIVALYTLIVSNVGFGAGRAEAQERTTQAKPVPVTSAGSFALVDAGKSQAGMALFTLEANGADIREVLKSIFLKTGDEFSIAQDVTGKVDLVLKNATADVILRQIVALARPNIRITRTGTVYSVQRSELNVIPINREALMSGGSIPSQAGQRPTLNRPVTLSIPEGRPISLLNALQLIERQTQVPIRLDSRIPSDVAFVADFTQTPLTVVLDTLAKTGALKWSQQQNGSVLVSPADWLQVILGEWRVGVAPCAKCQHPLSVSWSFCPQCGAPNQKRRPGIRSQD